MPHAFTEDERREVEERLLAVARDHFARFGYRKANVADIARDAGIAKGTVYRFHESKGALFLEVAKAVERELRAELLEATDRPFPAPRDRLERFLRLQLEAFRDEPFLEVLVNPEEAPAIFRDLPECAGDELRAIDEEFFEGLVADWRRRGWLGEIEPRKLMGVCRSLFAVTVRRDLVGEEEFEAVADLLVESLAARLAPTSDTSR